MNNEKKNHCHFINSFFFLALLSFFLILYLSFGWETYCWWNPTIDTNFAPNYSEERFSLIKQGMTADEVIGLIGEPLKKFPWEIILKFGAIHKTEKAKLGIGLG
ncbi:MAG: hypothetical protein JKP90_00795 [Desulfofustis sp. PB-SRB1]|nr:hypothetical protein [Desulfofustis sp. PB-SRB1]